MILTRTSAELGAASIALAAAGFAAGYPELVLIAAAGAAALAGAVGWAAAGRFRLTAARSVEPDRPAAGQTLSVRLLVANSGSRSSRAVTLTEQVGGMPYGVRLPSLRARSEHLATYQVPAASRGRLRVQREPVVHCDPLGLVRIAVLPGEHAEIRVLPDWHPDVGPLPARGLASGSAQTGLPRGDVVLHSLREYRPGDPPRLIHWPATARRGGPPIVRELTDDGEPAQVLLLDTAAAGYDADGFEEAVRIVASLAVAAWRGGLGLELRTTTDGRLLEVDAADRPSLDPLAVLDPLCDVRQSPARSRLAEAVDELVDTVPTHRAGAVLGVVGGRLDRACAASLAGATGFFEAVYVIRVGAGLEPIEADGVVHLDVGTSRDFAAVAGTGWAV